MWITGFRFCESKRKSNASDCTVFLEPWLEGWEEGGGEGRRELGLPWLHQFYGILCATWVMWTIFRYQINTGKTKMWTIVELFVFTIFFKWACLLLCVYIYCAHWICGFNCSEPRRGMCVPKCVSPPTSRSWTPAGNRPRPRRPPRTWGRRGCWRGPPPPRRSSTGRGRARRTGSGRPRSVKTLKWFFIGKLQKGHYPTCFGSLLAEEPSGGGTAEGKRVFFFVFMPSFSSKTT